MGNRNILFYKKPIFFSNWIKDGIIYINDLLNDYNEFDQQDLYKKVSNKSNWFSEISILLQAIPKTWKHTLNSQTSIASSVRVDPNLYIFHGKRSFDFLLVKDNLCYACSPFFSFTD